MIAGKVSTNICKMQIAPQPCRQAPGFLRSSCLQRASYKKRSDGRRSPVTPTHRSRQTAPAQGLHVCAAGEFDSASVAAPGLQDELRKALDDFIAQNKIILFMKGTQQFPQCGFSNTCVQIFNALGVPADQFKCVNILEDESLRAGLKEYSMWPTFPQVYIDGEFYGGCDVMIEGYQNGELQETVERVLAS